MRYVNRVVIHRGLQYGPSITKGLITPFTPDKKSVVQTTLPLTSLNI